MRSTPAILVAVVLAAAIVLAAGCSTQPANANQEYLYKKKYEQCMAQNDALASQLAALQRSKDDADAQLIALQKNITEREQTLSTREQEIIRLQEALKDLGATIRGNGVGVPLESDVLFDSGKTVIKDNGKMALQNLQDKIAEVLKAGGFNIEYIRIDGHTDSDPIRATADQFKDNWMLGAARANAVREFLEEVGGLSTDYKLYLASYADTVPVDPAATKEAKAKNRRVEIFIVPAAK
jgi:chemotaxis protein MotB